LRRKRRTKAQVPATSLNEGKVLSKTMEEAMRKAGYAARIEGRAQTKPAELTILKERVPPT
jgi:hypothetical protein